MPLLSNKQSAERAALLAIFQSYGCAKTQAKVHALYYAYKQFDSRIILFGLHMYELRNGTDEYGKKLFAPLFLLPSAQLHTILTPYLKIDSYSRLRYDLTKIPRRIPLPTRA